MQTISIQCFNWAYHYDKTIGFMCTIADLKKRWKDAVKACECCSNIGYNYDIENYCDDTSVARCFVTMMDKNGTFAMSDVITVDLQRFKSCIEEIEKTVLLYNKMQVIDPQRLTMAMHKEKYSVWRKRSIGAGVNLGIAALYIDINEPSDRVIAMKGLPLYEWTPYLNEPLRNFELDFCLSRSMYDSDGEFKKLQKSLKEKWRQASISSQQHKEWREENRQKYMSNDDWRAIFNENVWFHIGCADENKDVSFRYISEENFRREFAYEIAFSRQDRLISHSSAYLYKEENSDGRELPFKEDFSFLLVNVEDRDFKVVHSNEIQPYICKPTEEQRLEQEMFFREHKRALKTMREEAKHWKTDANHKKNPKRTTHSLNSDSGLTWYESCFFHMGCGVILIALTVFFCFLMSTCTRAMEKSRYSMMPVACFVGRCTLRKRSENNFL